MATDNLTGKMGTVTVGSVAVDVVSWEAELEKNLQDVTTTADEGWGRDTVGIKRVTGTLTLLFDANKIPNATTFADLFADADTAVVLEACSTIADCEWAFDAKFEGIAQSNPIESRIEITTKFKSQGEVTTINS